MSTDIQLVIQEIEKERTYLKSEMDKAVAEGEYIEASLYEKAWKNTGQQLYILRCLQDKNYVALHHTEQVLKNSKEILKSLTKKQETSSTQNERFRHLEINQLRKMMQRAESRKEKFYLNHTLQTWMAIKYYTYSMSSTTVESKASN